MSMGGRSGPNIPGLDEIDRELLGLMRDLTVNTITTRSRLISEGLDPRRNIEDECGYPPSASGYVDPDDYRRLYEREPVAARVVEVLPEETWKVQPTVYEVEDSSVLTPFEKAWQELPRGMRSGPSWHQDEKGSQMWEVLKRADRLSGIGHYGVMLLGIDDGRPLDKPAVPQVGRRLLFIRVFPESLATISTYETDATNPRFGQPLAYSITFSDPRHGVFDADGTEAPTAVSTVHWSRCIHIVDNVESSEVAGIPRMRPVLNPLLDIKKVRGGSAEMYWRGAFPGISIESDPSRGGEVEYNKEHLRDAIEQYMNGLQRYLSLNGFTAKSLAPQVVDPRPQVEVQIESICIKLAIPKRIFMGSERGDLASTQDKGEWNERVMARQRNHVTPRIIVPLVDRLIYLGVLPEPAGYSVEWPDLTVQNNSERANVAYKKTQALGQYISTGAYMAMTPLDYFTLVFGLTESEAMAVVKNAQPVFDKLMTLMPSEVATMTGIQQTTSDTALDTSNDLSA